MNDVLGTFKKIKVDLRSCDTDEIKNNILNSKLINDMIDHKILYGSIETFDGSVDIRFVSYLITKIYSIDNELVVDIDVLNTPLGRILMEQLSKTPNTDFLGYLIGLNLLNFCEK